MKRSLLFVFLLLCGLLSSAALAQNEQRDPIHDASAVHEEHAHKNEVAGLVAVTYETEEKKSLFTVGGEYSRMLSSRLRVAGVAEHLSGPGAWVFVFPVAWRLWEGLWVAAGPGFEAKSRRSLAEEETHHDRTTEVHGADELASENLEGSEKFFLVRAGAYYIFELGGRYSLKTGVGIDWVDIGSGTATAVVYGVAFGAGF